MLDISLPELLLLKYPEINLMPITGNVSLQDCGDGKGAIVGHWGLDTPQPTEKELEEYRQDPSLLAAYEAKNNIVANQDLLKQLEDIDARSIRPLRENNTVKLQELILEAQDIRSQLLPMNIEDILIQEEVK